MSVNWSTLGIVADGVTDNTVALNALPTGVDIIGDTGTGIVMFGNPASGPKNWRLQSNMTLHLNNCPMVTVFQNGGFTGAVSQADPINTPLTNVFIDGLNLKKPSIAVTGRMILWNINHMTLTNFQIGNHNGALEFIGSDWEIGNGTIYNSQQGGGNPGIKSAGNFPKVLTTPGRPANIWVHDVNVASGDAALQVATVQSGVAWGNISADDYLWENFVGASNFAEGILVAASKSHGAGGNFDCSISNIIFRNGTAQGTNNLGVSVRNEINVQGVSNVQIKNVGITQSVGISAISSPGLPSPVSNITFDSCTVSGVNDPNGLGSRDMDIQGNTSDITINNCNLAAPATPTPPNPQNNGNIRIGGGSRINIINNTIDSNNQDVILVGGKQTAFFVSIIGNTILDVANGKAGIRFNGCQSCQAARNEIFPDPAFPHGNAAGIEFDDASANSIGAVNCSATANNVSAMTADPRIIFTCNNGVQNFILGNTGFEDITCVLPASSAVFSTSGRPLRKKPGYAWSKAAQGKMGR